jgi:transposase
MIKPYEIPAGFSDKTPANMLFAELMVAHKANLAALEREVLLADHNAHLAAENARLKQKLFGRSSEKRKPKNEATSEAEPTPMDQIFDEATLTDNDDHSAALDQAATAVTPPEPSTTTPSPKNKRRRKPLPAHLPRENVIHDIAPEENVCPCGCLRSKIGEEVSEQLEVIPAQLKVIRHIRYKYGCRHCEEGIVTAPMPKQPLPKGIPTAGLLSHVCVAKFDDHLPLYRQSEIWERLGIDLPRSTLSSWVLHVGTLLHPLIHLFQTHILQSGYINADETTVQVLRTPDKRDTAKSYMWVYMTGKRPAVDLLGTSSLPPAIVYEYQPTRHADHAHTFLTGFNGILQTDGYSGYHAVVKANAVIHVGCWAHARRKFYEVWVVLKKEGVSSKALDIIGKLYDMERMLSENNSTADEIKAYRQEHAKPLLEAFKRWLTEIKPKVPPKSPLAKAIYYTLNQWIPLTRYLEDGTIAIDNNVAERQIRPFTVGRKNWLFMGSVAGAKAGAVIYSLIETAKANELNPEAYLRYVLERMPSMDPTEYHQLLPWQVTLPVGYVENTS